MSGARAELVRYIQTFALPERPDAGFFRRELAGLTAAFERVLEAGEMGERLVPEAAAMVLLARLEAGAPREPGLLDGLLD